MTTIYIDVLFAVNFVIDYMLFYVSACVAGRRMNHLRLFSAAAVGGLYSCMIFFPRLGIIFSLAIKLSASALLVIIAYRLKNIKDFFFMLMVFYIVNFAFAGGVAGTMYFTDFGAKTNALLSNGSLYLELPMLKLFITTFVIAGALQGGIMFIKENLKRKGILCKIAIFEREKHAEIYGILDTGNSLTSSGIPVMVVQFCDIAKLFEKHIADAIEIGDITGVIAQSDEKWAKKMRLVSYTAIGTKSGILIGFIPDKVVIETMEGKNRCNCVVAVYTGKLKSGAVVNPDMLKGKDEQNGYCNVVAGKNT